MLNKLSKELKKKLEESKFLSLDVGCGAFKRKGAVGMDAKQYNGVDVVHDLTLFPWPIPSSSCGLITANHLLEHIPKTGCPSQVAALVDLLVKRKVISKKDVGDYIGETNILSYLMRFMDECWRVMKVDGQLAMVLPYAGSIGFYQDPSHAAPITEATFFYFDPEHDSKVWHVYKPKPWKIELNTYQVNGNLEVVLSKRAMKKEYE